VPNLLFFLCQFLSYFHSFFRACPFLLTLSITFYFPFLFLSHFRVCSLPFLESIPFSVSLVFSVSFVSVPFS
jgi:hypothetical protein